MDDTGWRWPSPGFSETAPPRPAAHRGRASFVETFSRLFGDGNGRLDDADLAAFLAAYRSRLGMARYRWCLDANGDRVIDALDYYWLLRSYWDGSNP
jgi:hypothetical protein